MTKRLMFRVGAAALAGTLVIVPAGLFPAEVAAQSVWEAQARERLNLEATDFLPDYQLAQQILTGSIPMSGTATRSIRLQGGVEYAILGACDDDCSDLDLRVFDRNNTLIDADEEPDNIPMITITPTRTANYRIQAEMFSCSNEPCYYALGVYRR